MSPRLTLAALGLAALIATGCGQTGALRLPAQAPERESYLIGRNPNARPKTVEPAPAPTVQPAEPDPAVPAP
jgi:hypothetical protein